MIFCLITGYGATRYKSQRPYKIRSSLVAGSSSLLYSGFSQSSVSTPSVDFGCRKAMFSPSAPLRGALSIRRMPAASADASALATPSSMANARWCIPPLPLFFSMNLAMVLSGEVGSSNSIFTSPTFRKAVLTFWSSTVSML